MSEKVVPQLGGQRGTQETHIRHCTATHFPCDLIFSEPSFPIYNEGMIGAAKLPQQEYCEDKYIKLRGTQIFW